MSGTTIGVIKGDTRRVDYGTCHRLPINHCVTQVSISFSRYFST